MVGKFQAPQAVQRRWMDFLFFREEETEVVGVGGGSGEKRGKQGKNRKAIEGTG